MLDETRQLRWIQSAISSVALALVALHLARPSWTVDLATVGLLVVAVLPWLPGIVKSVEITGVGKFEFQELKSRVDEQQRMIEQLVIYSMSDSIYRHLWSIAKWSEYLYDDAADTRREMYFLRDNGFIQPQRDDFVQFNGTTKGENLAKYAKPTPIGEFILQFRGPPPGQARAPGA